MNSIFLRLTLISFIIILFIPNLTYAQAYLNEPDGFRKYKWGDLLENIKSEMEYEKTIKYAENISIDFYTKKGDLLKIGDATLSSISYGFWRGRLIQVGINCHDQRNILSLKKATFKQFGEIPNAYADKLHSKGLFHYEWGKGYFENLPKAQTTSIFLSFTDKYDYGSLYLSSVKLFDDLTKEIIQLNKKSQGW